MAKGVEKVFGEILQKHLSDPSEWKEVFQQLVDSSRYLTEAWA